MPKRSTPRQAVVYWIRKHLAGDSSSVTESKFLTCGRTGAEREVDVVVESELDGVPIVVSFEVVDRARPSDRPWVESMIAKHGTLPTNQLYLVSWAGFTRDANKLMAATPRVEGLSPTRQSLKGGGQAVKRMTHSSYGMTPQTVRAKLALPADATAWVRLDPDHEFRSSDQRLPSTTVQDFAERFLSDASVVELTFSELRQNPDADAIRFVVVGGTWDPTDPPFHLWNLDADEPHHVVEVQIIATLDYEERPIDLELGTMMDVHYAHGRVASRGTSLDITLTSDLPLRPDDATPDGTRGWFRLLG